jgi:hypothetical protein
MVGGASTQCTRARAARHINKHVQVAGVDRPARTVESALIFLSSCRPIQYRAQTGVHAAAAGAAAAAVADTDGAAKRCRDLPTPHIVI